MPDADRAHSEASNGPKPLEAVISTAADNPAADVRNMRRIIAEDPEWSLATVPLLWELCIAHIVQNFQYNSKVLDKLLPAHKVKVLSKLSTKLPLKITANLIEDEDYWKRCCKDRWAVCDVSRFGNKWKRMYFERNLQEIIENFVPESTDSSELHETLPLSAKYVQRLEIRQLLPPVKIISKNEDDTSDVGSDIGDVPDIDHFEFDPVFKTLPYITEFTVQYGVLDCGMNFEWNLFNFTARDCLQLSKALKEVKTLQVFTLHQSKVDDEKVRVLISHLLDHPSLVKLHLCHNTIGDRGARALGKLINNRSKLTHLDVSDNCIRAAGAQAIAHALTKNTTLKHLNLRLNRIGDDGGQAICKALLKNTTLRELNLGSNDFAEPTAAVLSRVVRENTTVRKIDLSCNKLNPDGGKQLQEGMEENETILYMDLRLTDSGQESEYCISQILHRNREKERKNHPLGALDFMNL